jgi:cell division transport system permease protein
MALRRNVSYLPALFSISLVMFVFGMLCLFMLEANKLKKAIKEDVRMSIYLRDEANDSLVTAIKSGLLKRNYVFDVRYISKEEGLKLISNNVGENPDSLLGFNPIPKTLEVRFREKFVMEDSLEILKKKFEAIKDVREVAYDKTVVQHIDRNMRRVGFVLLGIAILMILISITLINNTIRLTMYSKRFIIKSMQFVGATRGFITRPFLYKGLAIGICGGILACGMLAGSIKALSIYFPLGPLLHDYLNIGMIMFGIIILSILICLSSSWLAINRYLRLKLDDLF